VFADSWKEAVVLCQRLLDHPEQLAATQLAVHLWWKQTFTAARHILNRP
jgi:hypothetical protein